MSPSKITWAVAMVGVSLLLAMVTAVAITEIAVHVGSGTESMFEWVREEFVR